MEDDGLWFRAPTWTVEERFRVFVRFGTGDPEGVGSFVFAFSLSLPLTLLRLLYSFVFSGLGVPRGGDPTLTVMGTEQPFAGRFRVALRGRMRGDRLDDVTVLEGRTDVSLAWSPLPSLSLCLGQRSTLRQQRASLSSLRTPSY